MIEDKNRYIKVVTPLPVICRYRNRNPKKKGDGGLESGK